MSAKLKLLKACFAGYGIKLSDASIKCRIGYWRLYALVNQNARPTEEEISKLEELLNMDLKFLFNDGERVGV